MGYAKFSDRVMRNLPVSKPATSFVVKPIILDRGIRDLSIQPSKGTLIAHDREALRGYLWRLQSSLLRSGFQLRMTAQGHRESAVVIQDSDAFRGFLAGKIFPEYWESLQLSSPFPGARIRRPEENSPFQRPLMITFQWEDPNSYGVDIAYEGEPPSVTVGAEEPEEGIDQALNRIVESLPGTTGVLIVGPEALESRAGLEEFFRRAPQVLVHRILFFAVGFVLAQRLRELNPQVQVIEGHDLTGLVTTLMAMPEADRITVLGGAMDLVQRLRQMVPPSMSVAYLTLEVAFRFILAALGTPEDTLDKVNTTGLEEQRARQRAA